MEKIGYTTETFRITSVQRIDEDGEVEYLMVDIVHKGDDRYEAYIYYPSEEVKMVIFAAQGPYDMFVQCVRDTIRDREKIYRYHELYCFY